MSLNLADHAYCLCVDMYIAACIGCTGEDDHTASQAMYTLHEITPSPLPSTLRHTTLDVGHYSTVKEEGT